MTSLDGHPFYIRSDGYLIIIRNRERFKSAPIITSEDAPLAVGSIADSISARYDKFINNIVPSFSKDFANGASTGHRIPFVGGSPSNYKQKGVTIQVMDKKAQEEAEKKK